MAKTNPDERNRLTICLTGDVAKRLELVAARQNRAASDVAAELLDRYLPRLEGREGKKGKKIPYT